MERTLHDVKNLIRRLEIMADILSRPENTGRREEVLRDLDADLAKLRELFGKLPQ